MKWKRKFDLNMRPSFYRPSPPPPHQTHRRRRKKLYENHLTYERNLGFHFIFRLQFKSSRITRIRNVFITFSQLADLFIFFDLPKSYLLCNETSALCHHCKLKKNHIITRYLYCRKKGNKRSRKKKIFF